MYGVHSKLRTCGYSQLASPSDLSIMSPNDRSGGRNVHIYDTNDPDTVLGGLQVTNGVTNANFHSMVEIIFFFSSDYFLRDEGGNPILRDDRPLQPNKYYIVTQGRSLCDHMIKLPQNLSFQVPSLSLMRLHCFVRFRRLPELVSKASGMLFVTEIGGVL